MESSQTLEFVSLLLSKYTPIQAEQSLGFLKQLVPLGSLDASPVQPPPVSSGEFDNQSLLALGWKVKSLQSSADSLLASAKRLEIEVRKESSYWGDVLNLKQEGWAVCRKPDEPHTLAIRYGFEESRARQIKHRLAALRRNDEGKVHLDFDGTGTERRLLQVKIFRNGIIVGRNKASKEQTKREHGSSGDILLARKSLFDAELYSELQREAQTLMSWGVRALDDEIRAPIASDSTIGVSLVSLNDTDPEISVDGTATLQAEAIATSLRILLDHAHEESSQQRSRPPRPVTEKPPPKAPYHLIRPILEYFNHASASSSMARLFRGLSEMLSAAQFSTTVLISDTTIPALIEFDNTSSTAAVVPATGPGTPMSSSSPVHTLVSSFLQPRRSHARISLPFRTPKSVNLSVDIFTRISPPKHHGTSFRASVSPKPSSSALTDIPSDRTFPDFQSFKQHVLHLVRIVVTEEISAHMPEDWGICQPHLGLLEAKSYGLEQSGGLEIMLDDLEESVSMTLRTFTGHGGKIKGKSKTWNGLQTKDGEEPEGVIDLAKKMYQG